MDNLIQILFNTNHEMPSGYVLIVLVAICLIVPPLSRYILQKRMSEKEERAGKQAESDGASEEGSEKKSS